MQHQELIPHLFRTEYRKIVAVLTRLFGFSQVEIAEDIASDTFLTASETWGLKGIPPNPSAWLYNVAKNKARNYLHRQHIFDAGITPELKGVGETSVEPEFDLSPKNINDSQLQMMFAICNPVISIEAQIGLSLRILCGFGIEEIADAFLSNKETINKRLFRAKEKLREEKINLELPGKRDIDERLSTVLKTIYLLFNEGYYSRSKNKMLRKELCLEAMRLCYILVENSFTNKPAVNALISLMCFHASRFHARTNDRGEQVLYEEQDTSLWEADLISKGEYFLNCASTGRKLTRYHLEAAIAFWHTVKEDSKEKWESILSLYNQLLMMEYSPVAALNRTYALSKARSKQEAVIEALKLNLTGNHFYHVLLGELYRETDKEKARDNFLKAMKLAKTETERQSIQKKINALV